jgi:hypothetical protein
VFPTAPESTTGSFAPGTGRFTDRKIAFSDVADDRLAAEVAKERLQDS